MSTSGIKSTLAAIATIGILLTGCDSSIGGTAAPSTPPASSAAGENPFPSRNQCALLDQILTGKGFPKATATLVDPKRTCAAHKLTVGTVDGADVSLSLQDGQLYTDNINVPSTARHGDVNGRPSIEQPEPLGSPGQCQVGMAVAQHSRALVLVTGGSDTTASCRTAENLAVALEPLLPKN